jgi:hypothetical protein
MESGLSISHDFADESMVSKARWFQSLTLQQKMDMLCEYTDLAFSLNPNIKDAEIAGQAKGRIQVLSRE